MIKVRFIRWHRCFYVPTLVIVTSACNRREHTYLWCNLPQNKIIMYCFLWNVLYNILRFFFITISCNYFLRLTDNFLLQWRTTQTWNIIITYISTTVLACMQRDSMTTVQGMITLYVYYKKTTKFFFLIFLPVTMK